MFDPASLEEQETIIRISPSDDTVHIWTNYPTHYRHFDKDARYTLIDVSPDGARFEIPRSEYNPVKGAKNRMNLTEEQRAARSEAAKKNLKRGE